jgi:CheY-like chemotaxis protein
MKTIRLLIVEDDASTAQTLDRLYRDTFAAEGFDSVTIELAGDAERAHTLAKAAAKHPYDLVSLDVHLGHSYLTGLDVLETLKRHKSSWMVALLTGVETDATVDEKMGERKGDDLRKNLRRDAYKRFDAERLVVVEKPSPSLPDAEARRLLEDRVRQIALLYGEISRLRYVFRAIEVVSKERVKTPKGTRANRKFIDTVALHWQIRFNCGDLRSLPDRAGFRTLHRLLSLRSDESLTPEEALVSEPRKEKPTPAEPGGDPVARYFEAQGIPWHELNRAEQDKLMRAALSLRFNRYVDLRKFQDEGDLSAEEGDELDRIVAEICPLHAAAETAYQRLIGGDEVSAHEKALSLAAASQEGLQSAGGNYQRNQGRRRYDSSAAQSFRARWKRSKDYLRENGFFDLAQHLEDYVMSTGASWSYNPPSGVEWTT